ncbi:hypothetical protein V1517DRAFT_355377 [Lipomyces orientalis]|uniref:Uncharacterized protein n=1 Tax=Lipomyces orientalis TaxID=1233043 RepID=A0ACC3TD30_9ASCO
MALKVFLTGATGFVGGDILYSVSRTHPDWEWTCLVRNKDKGAKAADAYPDVRLVYGDIDDVGLIEEEASKADIVFHTAASDDHVPSAEAIVRGLACRQVDGPGYYIHTSGALSLASETRVTGRYGDRFDKVYDDWDNVNELTSHPDHTPHGMVDKIILAAGSDKTRVAIVAPSVIYGVGRGPDNTTSFPLFNAFLKNKKVFAVGKGDNIWHYVHVRDLSNTANGGSPATWNDEGYYLAENGSYVTREMLQLTAQIAHKKGLLPSPEVVFVTPDEGDKLLPWARIVLGVNSRGIALRARKQLVWKPSMPSFEDEIGNSVDIEARLMGLI